MDILTIPHLVAEGRPREQAARLAAADSLRPVRPGMYLAPSVWDSMDEEQRHLARMRAAQLRLGAATVFGMESAALVQGIPVLAGRPGRPCVIVRPGGSRSSSLVRRVHAALAPGELEERNGFVLTSPLRTALDLAATLSPMAGAIALSDVARRFGVTPAAIEAAVDERRRFRGVRRIAFAAGEASRASESPLESLVLVRVRDLGFEEPEQQRTFEVDGLVYRVDFFWAEPGVVLEADGRMKYVGPEALWAEKLREDALRGVVRRFVRTTWEEAWDATALARKLEAAGVRRVRAPRPLTR